MITTQLHPAFNTPFDDVVDGTKVDHNRILADLVQCGLPLIEIAQNHKLRLDQLIAWAAQPAFRSLLDAADELADRIAAHKAAQGRTAAVQILIGQATGLCETTREQGIAGSAARAVLRFHARSTRKPSRGRPKPADLREVAGAASPGDTRKAHAQASAESLAPQSEADLPPRMLRPAARSPVHPARPAPFSPAGHESLACPAPDLHSIDVQANGHARGPRAEHPP